MKFQIIITFLLCILFSGCGPSSRTSAGSESFSAEKNKLLQKAGACSEELKKDYEAEIQEKEKRWEEEKLSSQQLKTSLIKMAENLKCE